MKCPSCGVEMQKGIDKRDHPMYRKTMYHCRELTCEVDTVVISFRDKEK